jgi:general secretion pathway protein N
MAVIRVTGRFGAVFVICSALTALAAAGSIGDRADFWPQAEAGSLAAEANDVADAAGLSKAPRTPDPGAKSRAGNPLWTVPLRALSATRDRPLFSASRRPPIETVPAAPLPQKQETLAPPPPERPLLTLVGTIVSREASLAVLQGSNTDAISRLRLGQENDGWQVQGIGLRAIVVEKGAQSVELALPRPNGAPAR